MASSWASVCLSPPASGRAAPVVSAAAQTASPARSMTTTARPASASLPVLGLINVGLFTRTRLVNGVIDPRGPIMGAPADRDGSPNISARCASASRPPSCPLSDGPSTPLAAQVGVTVPAAPVNAGWQVPFPTGCGRSGEVGSYAGRPAHSSGRCRESGGLRSLQREHVSDAGVLHGQMRVPATLGHDPPREVPRLSAPATARRARHQGRAIPVGSRDSARVRLSSTSRPPGRSSRCMRQVTRERFGRSTGQTARPPAWAGYRGVLPRGCRSAADHGVERRLGRDLPAVCELLEGEHLERGGAARVVDVGPQVAVPVLAGARAELEPRRHREGAGVEAVGAEVCAREGQS